MAAVGERLRQIREEHDLSLEYKAKRYGKQVVTVSKFSIQPALFVLWLQKQRR